MINEKKNVCTLTTHDQSLSWKCIKRSSSNEERNLRALASRTRVTCSPVPEPELDNRTAARESTQRATGSTAHGGSLTSGIEHGQLDCRRGVLRRLCSARRWRAAGEAEREAIVGGSITGLNERPNYGGNFNGGRKRKAKRGAKEEMSMG